MSSEVFLFSPFFACSVITVLNAKASEAKMEEENHKKTMGETNEWYEGNSAYNTIRALDRPTASEGKVPVPPPPPPPPSKLTTDATYLLRPVMRCSHLLCRRQSPAGKWSSTTVCCTSPGCWNTWKLCTHPPY